MAIFFSLKQNCIPVYNWNNILRHFEIKTFLVYFFLNLKFSFTYEYFCMPLSYSKHIHCCPCNVHLLTESCGQSNFYEHITSLQGVSNHCFLLLISVNRYNFLQKIMDYSCYHLHNFEFSCPFLRLPAT